MQENKLLYIEESLKKYQTNKDYIYGTAGFRDKADNIHHIYYRCGLISVLRSYQSKNKSIGICITASHNPFDDNGIKLIDYNGEMFPEEYENIITEFINNKISIYNIFDYFNINFNIFKENPNLFKDTLIYIGYDTRESSLILYNILKTSLIHMGAQYINLGQITTPIIHSIIYYNYIYHIQLQDIWYYFNNICSKINYFPYKPKNHLIIDLANGVGSIFIPQLYSILNQLLLSITFINTNIFNQKLLNHQCGADYVQKNHQLPLTMNLNPLLRGCSFDGDADRIIYYYIDTNQKFHLLDGDKISALYTIALYNLLKDIHSLNENNLDIDPLSIGIIQTAYANGKSTEFYKSLNHKIKEMSNINLTICCVPTGVKHLFKESKKYDISILFESNGHGTLVKNLNRLEQWAQHKQINHTAEYKKLIAFLELFGESTGDAIRNLIATEIILQHFNIDIFTWDNYYNEIPSIQKTLHVNSNQLELFKLKETSIQLKEPQIIQESLNSLILKYPNSRIFVRPSGTEPVLRLYAESNTLDNCQSLIKEMEDLLNNFLKNH